MKINKKRLRELIVEETQALEVAEKIENDPTTYILEEVERHLTEAEITLDLYVLNASLTHDKAQSTTDVLNSIRAIQGVTRCSTPGKSTDLGGNMLQSLLEIKIVKDASRMALQTYINLLLKTVLKIDGVTRIKLLEVTQVER